ncbi:MAG TPA: cytochrome c peroxidase [Candidatus Competibacter sp.]|nr:cytochrome c peroxidase [Candidatus Competibacter sp.]
MNASMPIDQRTDNDRWRSASWLCGLLSAILLIAGSAISVWSAPASDPQAGVSAAMEEPIAPLPLASSENPAKVALGERLFGDVRLSRDRSMSCATCHRFDRGGADGLPVAKRADGTLLAHNTPTIFNAGFNYFYNWDGSTETLEAHAERLMLNPDVMDADWPELLGRLRADPSYDAGFKAAYPSGLNKISVLDAIAAYERSLVTPNSRFDQYLRGQRDALTEAERHGYQLFKSYGCVACHQGMNIGGNMFQRFGIFPYFRPPADANKSGGRVDFGRFQVTRIERDRHVFRVPSLRNVALTAPYFHDGQAATLESAVDTMAQVQLGKTLTPEEIGLIVHFLHTLTGEYRGQPLVTPAPGTLE